MGFLKNWIQENKNNVSEDELTSWEKRLFSMNNNEINNIDNKRYARIIFSEIKEKKKKNKKIKSEKELKNKVIKNKKIS